MKKSRLIVALSFMIPLLLCGCNSQSEEKVKVILEEGDYHSTTHTLSLDKGSDFIFDVTLSIDKVVSGSSYKNYSIIETTDTFFRYDKITFHQVMYSTVISLDISSGIKINYSGNDKTKEEYVSKTHERINTSNDYNYFKKDGYAFVGWQNNEEIISLGSRVTASNDLSLNAYYLKESETSLFAYHELDASRVEIESYIGNEKDIVIPSRINDKNVTSIKAGSFNGLDIETLVLPYTLGSVGHGTFTNCHIGNLVFYDNLVDIDDDSFTNTIVDHVRINALNNPAYSKTYYATYTDKVDRLMSLKEKKKIILYSGSSTRFGFDSRLIDEAFLDYEVVNMGVFAYTQSMPQVEVISHFVNKDDIVIISPEFDVIDKQINLEKVFDYYFFNLIETNYDILQYLDLKTYSHFFNAYKEYQNNRKNISRGSYSDSPSLYDEDMKLVNTPSYNRYGDYILYRKDNTSMEPFGIKRAFYNKKYFPIGYINAFNQGLELFKNKEVNVYYDYSPRMNISISEDSTPESIDELGEYLKENIDLIIISSISESLMSPLYFYETDNHLSTSGVEIRTRRVISNLSQIIER